MKEEEVRSKTKQLYERARELGFSIRDLDIDIYTDTFHEVSDLIPYTRMEWRVTLEVAASIMEVK